MSDKHLIEVGDFVRVCFKDSTRDFHGRVMYTPCATGDCWHICPTTGEDYHSNVIYVQEFERMVLTTKSGAKP